MTSSDDTHSRWDLRPSLLSLLALFAGCGDEMPYNPALQVTSNPPVEISHKHLKSFELRIDDHDLGPETIELRHGDTARVTGTFVIDTSRFTSPAARGNLHIRFLPDGAFEQDWHDDPYTMEWVGAAKEQQEMPMEVTAPAGPYDVRAYLMLFDPYEDLPRFDLIAKGKVRVLPAESTDNGSAPARDPS